MKIEDLKIKINNINIWKKGDQRAPHKPLLLLYALAELKNNNNRLLPYQEVREKLMALLIEFGPVRKSYHPEEPFVRLHRDGIWKLSGNVNTQNPSNKVLKEENICGGFTDEVCGLLTKNPILINELAVTILNSHFPDTLHEDILRHIGLDIVKQEKRRRDPHFRERILRAYEYSCAICGFNVRLGNNLVAIEAAHIKWHQAGGPDNEENGIALCSMHHKLFDRGVLSINEARKIIVSEDANGTVGLNEWLLNFHGKEFRSPINPNYQPNFSYINWHIREVFRSPERYII